MLQAAIQYYCTINIAIMGARLVYLFLVKFGTNAQLARIYNYY